MNFLEKCLIYESDPISKALSPLAEDSKIPLAGGSKNSLARVSKSKNSSNFIEHAYNMTYRANYKQLKYDKFYEDIVDNKWNKE